MSFITILGNFSRISEVICSRILCCGEIEESYIAYDDDPTCSSPILKDQSCDNNLTHTKMFREILFFYVSGALEVVYEAVMGSLGTLPENTSLASPGLDFNTTTMSFILEDGQLSATIAAPIINVSLSLTNDSVSISAVTLSCFHCNILCKCLYTVTLSLHHYTQDTDAELSEIFLVRLISVTLDPSEDGDIPPSIGTDNQAQVTILPNDNPEGILNFVQSRYTLQNLSHYIHTLSVCVCVFNPRVTVSEDVGQVALTVRRDQGTVGRVSAVILLIDQGATANEDYIRTNYEVEKYNTRIHNTHE